MKKITFALILSTLFINASAQTKWETLFNGKNLKGWKQLNGEAQYKVEDGAIVGVAVINTPNSFLATEKIFGDFIVEMDVKLEDRTNSGIQFRSNSFKEHNEGRVHGYQYELDPSERAWSGGIYDEARRGWLYNLENNPIAKSAFKFNEWNKVRIEAIGTSIRTWLNGYPCADILDSVTATGFIALQVHSIKDPAKVGARILWKNIRICTTNLTAEKTPDYGSILQLNYIDNTLSEQELQNGWELLFDGKSMDKWVSPTTKTFPAKGFDFENGELLVNKANKDKQRGEKEKGGGDIMTLKRYGDFELVFDFNVSIDGNNGIKYFYQTQVPEANSDNKGPEYQILDNTGHPDANGGFMPKCRQTAALYDMLPTVDLTKIYRGPGKWNTGRIVSKGGIVQHWLNGAKVLEYDRFSYVFDVLKNQSKFKECDKFGQFEDGHILITDHQDFVRFKSIKIREL